MTNEDLKKILWDHQHWLNKDCEGWQDMRADLTHADLTDANLRYANLRYANLTDVDLTHVAGSYSACPVEGAFVAWKKASLADTNEPCIVKLFIPEDAQRLSATTNKCRSDKAVVLEIQDIDGEVLHDVTALSTHDASFVYEVGETVEPTTPFDENRWNEYSSGIHFFVDRRAVVEY